MDAIQRGPSPNAESLSRELDPDGALVAAGPWGSSRSMTAKRRAPCARHPGRAHRPLLTSARKQRGLWTATSGTVVGTPTLRPEDVARLARAYYHDDPQLIDETSARGEDGRWRYRDPRRHARGRCASAVPNSRNALTATGRGSSMGVWS